MNYRRIYLEFIEDRRGREDALIGYSEKHHIIPKCMGGDNSPANLIRLTPEDHFFAHLCLAKAYGGVLWRAIAFMVGLHRERWSPRKSRKAYGWASRRLAQDVSEQKTHATVFDLVHLDGRSWTGRQADMGSLGISKPLANMLLKRRVKSAKGWYLATEPRPQRGGSAHPMYRKQNYTFTHESGATFQGTQHEFATAMKAPKAGVCRLVNGKQEKWRGWRAHSTGA